MATVSQTESTIHVQEKPGDGHIKATGTTPPGAKLQHFGDWPNDSGFNASREQREPKELKVTGNIPSYAAGVLYRTGPGHYKVPDTPKGEFSISHWFDGFTHLHRFQIDSQPDGTTRVVYNSRQQIDKLLEYVRRTGKLEGISFGQKRDPCESLYQKLKSTFEPQHSSDKYTDNTGVTISLNTPGFRSDTTKDVLIATTDANRIKTIDPETLEPLGCANQTVLHPSLKGPLAAAHAQKDPKTGDVFNYNLNLGRQEVYRVFKTSASTGQTEILATLSGSKIRAAYLHSFFLTEDFVILCIWPSHFAAKGAKMLWERNIIDSLAPFDSSAETRWLVIDRKHGRGLVSTFTSPAMFCFHTVNAWQTPEKDGKVDLICELVQFDNMDVLRKLYYENLISTSPSVKDFVGPSAKYRSQPQLTRYRLSDVSVTDGSKKSVATAELIFNVKNGLSGDLPIINSQYKTKEHRFVYSVSGTEKSSFVEAICKTDTQTQTATHWEHPKHTPGEPIFVRNPEGAAEDDGVLLSVMLDGEKGTSYLLCLDAKSMTEIGRAECPIPVGFGFHGSHYPSS